MSPVSSEVIFKSMSFFSHVGGSIAETVINPSGGIAAFLDINFKACLKLQKESGHCGYTNNIFICIDLYFANPLMKKFIVEFFEAVLVNKIKYSLCKLRKIESGIPYRISIITYIIHTSSRVLRLLFLSFLKCDGVKPVNFLN